MGYVDSAVKRGLEHPATAQMFRRFSEKPKPDIQIPGWGVTILVVTFVVFVISMSMIEYTLKDVIATLAMIETPSAAITVSPSEESTPTDVKEGLLETGPQIALVHQKPITTSIRGTIRHLVSQAGRLSRWRGLRSLVLYSFCFSIAANILDAIVPSIIPGRLVIITGVSGALLANLHAAWTHKVISMPNDQGLWARVPSRKQWKLLALPAAVEASAKYVSIYIAQGVVTLLGLNTFTKDDVEAYKGHEWALFGVKLLGVFVIVLACGLFIVLPALVTLIRVEASILPEEQDTIVPFDRTFAGKVVPTILGGTGSIGFVDAWKSFNWEARRRLIKLYVKFFAIVMVLSIAFSHVFMLEIWAIMGSQFGEALANARHNGFNQM